MVAPRSLRTAPQDVPVAASPRPVSTEHPTVPATTTRDSARQILSGLCASTRKHVCPTVARQKSTKRFTVRARAVRRRRATRGRRRAARGRACGPCRDRGVWTAGAPAPRRRASRRRGLRGNRDRSGPERRDNTPAPRGAYSKGGSRRRRGCHVDTPRARTRSRDEEIPATSRSAESPRVSTGVGVAAATEYPRGSRGVAATRPRKIQTKQTHLEGAARFGSRPVRDRRTGRTRPPPPPWPD